MSSVYRDPVSSIASSESSITGHEFNRDQSITIPSSGNINKQRRQVNLLCNSFSDLALDFNTKLCKSFEEITSDIDQISNMIKFTPRPRSFSERLDSDLKQKSEIKPTSKSMLITESKFDLVPRLKSCQYSDATRELGQRS